MCYSWMAGLETTAHSPLTKGDSHNQVREMRSQEKVSYQESPLLQHIFAEVVGG